METALVSMMLVTILYGIVETSFLMRDAMVVSSASRAGVRMASSMPRSLAAGTEGAAQVQDALSGVNLARVPEVWIYKADASTGATPSGNFTTCATNCIKYTWGGTSFTPSGSTAWLATLNACEGSQDYLGVYVRYTYPSRIGLFNNKALTEQTVMRLEPYVGLLTCS